MLISIDTVLMNELADLANAVCEELTEANICFNPITTHDDWNCAERDKINDIIINCKKYADALKEGSQNFSSSVRKAADSFDAFERQNPQALLNLHSVFERALVIPTPKLPWHPIVGPGGIKPSKFVITNLIRERMKIIYGPGGIYKPKHNIDISPLSLSEINKYDEPIKVIQWETSPINH